ncbi:MAG TPA: aldehyde dehydrogenase family protein [Polyangiales bacterium]|nr:aldehyde dehydrogenase family protein [Polyangiales bacterium]
MKITNPATGELIREIPEDTRESVADKAKRARAAQKAWAVTPIAERVRILTRWKQLVAANEDQLAKTLTLEVGKPLAQSHNELRALDGRVAFFLDTAPSVVATEIAQKEPVEEQIRWEPLGVVANISAWNYPYFVGSNVFVPALLTGNAVLYKPSEHAAMTGLAIGELMQEAGVPPDVFQVIIGAGALGRALLEQPIDGVFFTGSYPTGRSIAESVAGRLVKVQLELGGKDPVYVCDDADPKVAAESLADGAMYNTGQSCCSVERIYVHEAIARPFVDAFMATVKGFIAGDPLDKNTYIGPLARKEQLAVLEAQVSDAVAKGATLLTGGKRDASRPQGYYFEPTVLVDVTSEMQVMRDESFGPIIGIQIVKSDDEAVRAMNDTEYGLTAGVFTKDRERAERLLTALDAGSVYWNCCDRVSPRLPWTGRHHSGIGSTLSAHGIRTFMQPKAYHLRSS